MLMNNYTVGNKLSDKNASYFGKIAIPKNIFLELQGSIQFSKVQNNRMHDFQNILPRNHKNTLK